MSFAWPDFLTLARSLHQDPGCPGPDEACLRSAVSRAYYAAYRTARDWAQSQSFTVTKEGREHEAVRRYFNRHSNIVANKVGADLLRLSRARNRADYDALIKGSWPRQAKAAVKRAQGVLDILTSLSAGPP